MSQAISKAISPNFFPVRSELCPAQHSDDGFLSALLGHIHVQVVPPTTPPTFLAASLRPGLAKTRAAAARRAASPASSSAAASVHSTGDDSDDDSVGSVERRVAAALSAQYLVRFACDVATRQLYPAPGLHLEAVWQALSRTGHASAVSSSSGTVRSVAGQIGGSDAATAPSPPPASPRSPPSSGAVSASSRGRKAARTGSLPGERGGETGDVDPFRAASDALQLSAIPPSIPCREEERAEIEQFIENAVHNGGSGCALYVSGMPGTGKTATVTEVVRELQERCQEEGGVKRGVAADSLPPFMYVEVNAMKLSHPYQLYTALWNAIARRSELASGGAVKRRKGAKALPQTSSTQRAVALLDEYFSKKDATRVPIVLLVDELDYLVTRKQTVLYNIFEWPTRRHSHLTVLGIANTMDLPERMLPKVHSRLGMGRLVFQPYTRDQIRVIVNDRLGALGIFDPKAVELASRKVAAISGDIRRALQTCRSAANLARARWLAAPAAQKPGVKVTAADINAAARQLAASNVVASLKGAAPLERLVLLSAALCQRNATSEDLSASAVLQRAATLRRTHLGETEDIAQTVWQGVLLRLCDCKLLRGNSASGLGIGASTLPGIRLNVQVDDVAFAFKEDSTLQAAAELLNN